jgi:hypothetical protein
MALTGIEQALIAGFVLTFGGVCGSMVSRYLSGNRCDRCGIDGLRRDIRVQFFMIRHLAQKQGTTNEELLQIEALANQALYDH